MMSATMVADIARIAHWKQVASAHDTDRMLRWSLPRVAASSQRVDEAERALRRSLPKQVRDFLCLADGWPALHVDVDLFGTAELIAGRAQSLIDRPDALSVLDAHGLASNDVVVIGGSEHDLDLFVAVLDGAPVLGGSVLWIAGQEVDQFPTFEAFLGAMVNYNAQIADRMAGTRH